MSINRGARLQTTNTLTALGFSMETRTGYPMILEAGEVWRVATTWRDEYGTLWAELTDGTDRIIVHEHALSDPDQWDEG